MHPLPRITALYALFALSGFCGLIYESIWSHYLKQFVGHAAYAQTLVLAVFMGGMGLGAWLAARYSHLIRNLLWGYAAVEALIGVLALAFHAGFGWLTDWAYATLLPATCAEEGICVTQWALATAMILPQSVLLGTTFPLMTGGILRLAPATPGRKLALLYFLNSVGAALGVLTCGFVLIPAIGLPGAMMTAGIGNLLLAITVYFLGKPRAGEPGLPAEAKPVRTTQDVPKEAMTSVLLAVALLTGLSSFIYEVVWIRMLSMVFGSATHSFEIMLASFILGLALGGAWIRKRIDRIGEVIVYLAMVQIAMGVLALATLPLYNHTFDAMAWLMSGLQRSDAGYAIFTLALKLMALVVMLPATFCAGMTLPLITYRLYTSGSGERAIGQVYAANTIGAICGVLLTVHVLMPILGLKSAMVVAGVIDITLGIWLLRRRFRVAARLSRAVPLVAVGALMFVAVSVFAFRFDPLRMGSSVFLDGRARLDANTEVLFAEDGKTATVHVTRFANGTVSLSTNGKSDGSIQMKPGESPVADEITMTLLGALPLIYRPDASEAAVIGFGTGMSSATLLGSPNLRRLDTIEIEPNMVKAAQHFRPRIDRAFTDARHRIVFEDAKAFLAKGRQRYDVIVSEPSNPWVSGVSSLFTQEFYARMRTHLKPGGVLVQWVHVYDITPRLVASIFGAMSASFPVYEVWMGSQGDMIVVASPDGPLPPISDQVFDMPLVRTMLDQVSIRSLDHLALQHVGDQELLSPLLDTFAAAANSDYFPVVDLNGPHARFLEASAAALTTIHQLPAPLVLALSGRPAQGYVGEADISRSPAGRQIPYLQAQELVSFVRDGAPMHAATRHISDVNLAIVVRNRLFSCEGKDPDHSSWDGVVRIAADTLPYLAQADALAFWRAARDSRCAPDLDETKKRWLELFVALAGSDWATATTFVNQLLLGSTGNASSENDQHHSLTPYQRLYLTQAGTAALIALGQGDAATELLVSQIRDLPPDEQNSIWVRLVVSRARLAVN